MLDVFSWTDVFEWSLAKIIWALFGAVCGAVLSTLYGRKKLFAEMARRFAEHDKKRTPNHHTGHTFNIENFTGNLTLGNTSNDEKSHYLASYPSNTTLAFHHFLPGELVVGTKAGDLSVRLAGKTIAEQTEAANNILNMLNIGEMLAPLKSKESKLAAIYGKPTISIATASKDGDGL